MKIMYHSIPILVFFFFVNVKVFVLTLTKDQYIMWVSAGNEMNGQWQSRIQFLYSM